MKHATSQNELKSAKTTHNSLNCLKRTPITQTHPKQEASVKFFIGVCKWNTCFPGIFEANFRMLPSHTGYQKHWVWASCNLSVQNSFWAYSALLKHHTVTQISQKKLKYIPKFKLGLTKTRPFYNYIRNIIGYSTMFLTTLIFIFFSFDDISNYSLVRL